MGLVLEGNVTSPVRLLVTPLTHGHLRYWRILICQALNCGLNTNSSSSPSVHQLTSGTWVFCLFSPHMEQCLRASSGRQLKFNWCIFVIHHSHNFPSHASFRCGGLFKLQDSRLLPLLCHCLRLVPVLCSNFQSLHHPTILLQAPTEGFKIYVITPQFLHIK